jgi:protocatechuate 3,4-dioxygenase beta subunit
MHDPSHRHGLHHDLQTLRAALHRRQLLRLFGGAVVTAIGCGDDGEPGDEGACSLTPAETAGPFPGDGSNGPDALALAGIVRSDLRSSFAGATGTADGVSLTIVLTLVDPGCAALPGHALYIWHCDRDAAYSMYSSAVRDENYLRGVQQTDADGQVTFQSIFPAAYGGRWPHIHFEVFPDLASIADAGNRLRTSQLALPAAACTAVYSTPGYETSAAEFARSSLDRDGVFRDGVSLQLADVTGDVATGYTATLTITVAT